jgi:hypothetical protein
MALQHQSKGCQLADQKIPVGEAVISRFQSTNNIWDMILVIVDATNILVTQDALFFGGRPCSGLIVWKSSGDLGFRGETISCTHQGHPMVPRYGCPAWT